MGAEANGEETVDETQEVQEGQEEVPLNETALRGRHRHRPGVMDETVRHDAVYGWVNE